MVLTLAEYIYGVVQFAVAFLSIAVGVLALMLFHSALKNKLLHAWRLLLISLLFFVIVELLGALKTFGIYSTPYLTHVTVSFILAFLIAALVKQININKGWIA